MTENMEFDFFGESATTEKASLDTIHEWGLELHQVRLDIKALEDKVSLLSKTKEDLNNKIIQGLKGQGLKSLPIAGVGTVTRTETMRVSMPKDPYSRKKVLEAFIENGWGDDITVHSQTLNSKFNYLVEQAELEGRTIELNSVLPGVEEPSIHESIQVRKGKNQ